MCGLTGVFALQEAKSADFLEATATAMNAAIAHRGPDSRAIWVEEESGVALAHRRLAIVDLSPGGYQPMHSPTGRYAIAFNGEIYNFLEIKKTLQDKGHQFKSQSDTEVLLAAIEEWGVEQALCEVNGMLAFALWDKQEKKLYLARDRMGKKPMYYGFAGKDFVFGSELKALRKHPKFRSEVDRDVLALYTRHNYVPEPWCILKGFYKLPAASFLVLSLGDAELPCPKKYWDIEKVAVEGARQPYQGSAAEMIDGLDDVLGQAVARRMIADVPLGSFLSGGIDSSLVTALMQKNSATPIKTFCIGFEEAGYNEAKDAKKIAQHLGTEHTEFYVSAQEARSVIPDLPYIYDEPFADPSQIPTFCVSRLARQHVTVALSGDGGDEAFAGYSRYHRAQRIAKAFDVLPQSLRHMAGAAIGLYSGGGRVEKFGELLRTRDNAEFYKIMLSYWKAPDALVKGAYEARAIMNDSSQLPDLDSFIHQMMYLDMRAYLPDDILVKVDRASMAVSLETRAPLLDYKVIEYAWRMPLTANLKNGEGKAALKTVLERYVPKALFDRPKQGFGIPHGEWIRGPLRDWAENLLAAERLKQEGYFEPRLVRKKWEEHVSGKKDWSYHLWGILMFQAWLEFWEA
jgi:asparagine synthase (glutamine-hydrolysing)